LLVRHHEVSEVIVVIDAGKLPTITYGVVKGKEESPGFAGALAGCHTAAGAEGEQRAVGCSSLSIQLVMEDSCEASGATEACICEEISERSC
jgi:hypothetical protein